LSTKWEATNCLNLRQTIGAVLVAIGVLVVGLKLGKVYDPVPTIQKLSVKAGPAVSNFVKKIGPDRVMYVLLVALPVGLGGILLTASTSKPKQEQVEAEHSTDTAVWKSQRAEKKTAVQSCNVLQAEIEPRQIWQFDARNGGFILNK